MKRLATLFAKVRSSLARLFMQSNRAGSEASGMGRAGPNATATRPDHYLLERYGLPERPEGWNGAVLGWFFRGPERRVPGADFRSAFQERAIQAERKERTLEWARRFRQSATDLPAEPEPDVHPLIHEAMRQSFISQAEDLEREAAAL